MWKSQVECSVVVGLSTQYLLLWLFLCFTTADTAKVWTQFVFSHLVNTKKKEILNNIYIKKTPLFVMKANMGDIETEEYNPEKG